MSDLMIHAFIFKFVHFKKDKAGLATKGTHLVGAKAL